MGQVQALFTQVAGLPQTLPHAPQLALSFVRLTHEPFGHWLGVFALHVVVQAPPLQSHWEVPGGSGIAAQLLPHAPQLARLEPRLTHWPLQRVWPIGQAHALLTHCWPPAHDRPHAPQLRTSLVKLAQALAQLVSGGPEPVAHVSTQVPFAQLGVVAEHAAPQLPQFLGSVLKSTQALLQAAKGGKHRLPSGKMGTSATGTSVTGASVMGRASVVLSPGPPSETAPSGRRPSTTVPSLAPIASARDAPSRSVVESSTPRSEPSDRPVSSVVRPQPSTTAAVTQISRHA